jgi:hypothetical protein
MRQKRRLHIGRDEWFICREHRLAWCSGSELNEWRRQDEAHQLRAYDELDLGSYNTVDPEGSVPPRDKIIAFWRRRRGKP